MLETLKQVGTKFRLPGTIYTYDIITIGKINSTYKVTYRNDKYNLKSYLFQKVNTNVFKNPVELMSNIDRVTSYIREKYPNQITLHFHHIEDGHNYYVCEDGYFWRVSNYVDSVTFDSIDDLDMISAIGEAFGRFQMQLSDFDGSMLYETIPDFHNTKKRLDTLFVDAEKDIAGRRTEVEEELEYIRSVRDKAAELSIRFANGEFPTRVTHNDTKANNVLFDPVTMRPIIVIDLDTVMPGMAMYDFGDAVRSIASTAVKDEPDLSKVFLDIAKFRAFTEGFIKEVKGVLTADEIDSLVQASFTVTIELASRYLDDYLNGDTYFKCNYPAHNLMRARCQLQLAKDIMRKRDELQRIVRDVVERV